ncbi:RNA polymerase sigma factor [Oceanobacillus picturae]|uniref:RNA polymerase sigma factor n=1 Tax=Oceanobacillus picturae TaxID=171693 RepID=A0A0U9H781_9BACI|nr:hypothetical protein [Oceanobacillus picturae]GAQ18251.1 RNA polymerase sigma factor [Oceanobacillus picturae]
MENRSNLLDEFKTSNKEFINQPVVKKFLKEAENECLLEKSLAGDTKSSILLDKKFKLYFKNAKVISYLNTLIHFYSVE